MANSRIKVLTDYNFKDWMALKGQVFRATQNRETLYFVKNGKGYFIKKHFGVGWRELWKNLVQLRLPVFDANCEYRAIKKLHELKVPTMTVVAYGQEGSNPVTRKSFIVVDELTKIISLEAVLQHPDIINNLLFRRKIILTLAKTTRVLHQHGVNHRDYYLCHFLLPKANLAQLKQGTFEPHPYLIDLHRVQIRAITPLRWRIKDVAGLYFSAMDAGLTPRDSWRFLRHYFALPIKTIHKRYRNFLKQVQQRAEKLYQKHYYQTEHTWHKLLVYRRDYYPDALQKILADPDKFIAQGQLLAGEDINAVARVQLQGADIVIKRYNLKKPWYFWTRLFKPSRAVRCWRNAQMLRRYYIKTPEPIAILEQRWGWLRQRSYYITQYISGLPGHKYLRQEKNPKQREYWARKLIAILDKLGKFKIRYGDAKAHNFLITTASVYVTDLDGMRQYSNLRYKLSKTAAKDKARLLRTWYQDPDISQLFLQLYNE